MNAPYTFFSTVNVPRGISLQNIWKKLFYLGHDAIKGWNNLAVLMTSFTVEDSSQWEGAKVYQWAKTMSMDQWILRPFP